MFTVHCLDAVLISAWQQTTAGLNWMFAFQIECQTKLSWMVGGGLAGLARDGKKGSLKDCVHVRYELPRKESLVT